MSPITFTFTVLALHAAVDAVAHHAHDSSMKHDKHDYSDKHPSCQEFTQGLSFNDSQAIGSWHLLHYKTEKDSGSGDAYCVDFSIVDKKDREELKALIQDYVENLKWENLVLKMQIPCLRMHSNKTRNYYLEKLEGNGSYRTLQMPPSTAKLNLAEFHRYPMRLKIIEGQYLGMMDCHEKFVFILGPESDKTNKDLDEKLKKMIEAYWPEE